MQSPASDKRLAVPRKTPDDEIDAKPAMVLEEGSPERTERPVARGIPAMAAEGGFEGRRSVQKCWAVWTHSLGVTGGWVAVVDVGDSDSSVRRLRLTGQGALRINPFRAEDAA